MDHDPASAGHPDDQPAEDLSSQATTRSTPPQPQRSAQPDRVGPYKILEVLGEGGMGIVYLAEQTEPVTRRVALKVIKLGMDTRQVVARFEAERQALAMMDHPNVAQVFGGGATEQGRPYFVMEHVPGVPITEHCDRQKLNIADRLNLFMQVCAAVQHAHQKGIIHRDIKPGNILVSLRDGEPVPKVIDFGVAKALHQKLTEKTLFTEQGQLIGTPEYMSPEQAEMTAQDVDTRSDIYSLGVLLYELLTGALPFDKRTLRSAAFGEIQRLIREVEPPRPSTRLSSLGDESKTSARNRHTEPRLLAGELRGDLDWIVMKALEKDRTRRYQTANSLAADLKRRLKNEPVLAGPPGAAYRMRKFVRRNRAGVAAAAIVLVVLLAGIVGTTWQAVAATRARDAEVRQRRIAEEAQLRASDEAANAKAINDFLTKDLLAAVAPSAESGRGKDVLMRDVLDEASKKIDKESKEGGKFADKPLIEASIRAALGWTYLELGEYDSAEPHLERALELRRHELDAENRDTLTSMNNLAILYWKQGRYNEAEAQYGKTLEIKKRILGAEHPSTLNTMNNLAILYRNQGRFDEAEQLYIATLGIRKRVLGAEHPRTLHSMNNLANLYARQGRFAEAEPLYVEALEIKKRIIGQEHPNTLNSMNNLAILYSRQGRYDEAEPLYVSVLEVRKRVLGAEHPDTLASMTNLASLYKDQDRYDDAEELSVKALEIKKRTLGAEHPDTLASMNNLALLYSNQGRYDNAEPLMRETLEVRKRVLGAEHPETLRTMRNLTGLYGKQGRMDDARPLVRTLNEIQLRRAERPGASSRNKNACAWTLLTCEPADLRDPETALRLARQAVDMTNAANPGVLDTLALAQHLTGDTPGAIQTEKKAISLLPAGPSPTRSALEESLAKYEAALDSADTPPSSHASPDAGVRQ